jgi:hypothetical protein
VAGEDDAVHLAGQGYGGDVGVLGFGQGLADSGASGAPPGLGIRLGVPVGGGVYGVGCPPPAEDPPVRGSHQRLELASPEVNPKYR